MDKTKIIIAGLIAIPLFIALLVGLFTVSDILSDFSQPTLTTGVIEELRIETKDATIYIKNLHYEIDSRLIWLGLLSQ